MKFARYLRDSLIPEWRKAYIDYRGLKKVISLIKENEDPPTGPPSRASPADPLGASTSKAAQEKPRKRPATPSTIRHDGKRSAEIAGDSLGQEVSRTVSVEGAPTESTMYNAAEVLNARSSLSVNCSKGGVVPKRSSRESIKSSKSGRRRPRVGRSITFLSSRPPSTEPQTLEELLFSLTPSEKLFFEKLNRELEKVTSFYDAREREARARSDVLADQLRELSEHREAFYEAYPEGEGRRRSLNIHGIGEAIKLAPQKLAGRVASTAGPSQQDERDPHDYMQARRKLKRVMQEYYRGLELLDNYRILNLTGFRKALKKFEKVTGILSAQTLYMNERIEPSKFASPHTLTDLRQKVEIAYAIGFAKGDRKRARDRLRADVTPRTHHFAVFRAGVFLGLGIPALVLGLVRSFDPYVRQQVSQWGPLLEIYTALFIIPVFAFLVGLNLCVWTRARINWVFIFDLDVRTAIDYREFFELPSLLFMTLCYAFMFTFLLVDSPRVAPTTWPLVWCVMAAVLLLDPIPVFRRRSRWWFCGMLGKLILAGATRVEFADFWLGDQLCSFAFTFANLYIFGCAYAVKWGNVFEVCNPANTWIAGCLSALPYAIRLAQCVRRWYDSGLKIHLLNAGKYASMIMVYAVYFFWRHRGAGRDMSFALYCLFATIGSIYTCSWDLLMDWSLLRPKAPRKFLREELIYSQYIFAYYFAIASNIVLRFTWLLYVPGGGLSLSVRAGIFGALEAFRRWQWNFYRVENEHIGNADRYRVTKEIPLPYNTRGREEDMDESDDDEGPLESDQRPNARRKSSRTQPNDEPSPDLHQQTLEP